MTHDDKQFIQQLFETQTQQFQRHLSVVAESFDHKLGLVVEGQQLLGEKVDRLEGRVGNLENRLESVELKVIAVENKIDGVADNLKATDERLSAKIDAIAADLKAHRADTEAHHGVYRVKESGDDWSR